MEAARWGANLPVPADPFEELAIVTVAPTQGVDRRGDAATKALFWGCQQNI